MAHVLRCKSKLRPVYDQARSEVRSFSLLRMSEPTSDASHLRGPCKHGHPLTIENAVRNGKLGFRCRWCRQSAPRSVRSY